VSDCENEMHVYHVPSAVAVLFRSPGLNSQQHTAAAQPPLFRSSDQATLLESFRNALSSQLRQVYGLDPADNSLWSEQPDLPVVAEESSDDEAGGAYARNVDEYNDFRQREDRVAGHVYSCDHCHCSVCKRSLEQHECQRSVSSSSEHDAVSDDAGGSVTTVSRLFTFRLLCAFQWHFVFVVKFLLF